MLIKKAKYTRSIIHIYYYILLGGGRPDLQKVCIIKDTAVSKHKTYQTYLKQETQNLIIKDIAVSYGGSKSKHTYKKLYH